MPKIRIRIFEFMKVTAYVCSNLEEIEKNREESQRLGIDPYDYITPEYQEETTWMHVDDILRARTKNVNGELPCIIVYTSDGNAIILKKSKKLESDLDKQFNPK